MLSRARKYKVSLTLAHQNTAQIPQDLLKEIFGNVTTFITFNVSSEDARKLSQEYAYDVGGEVAFVDPGRFIRLRTGHALCKIDRTIFGLETFLLPTPPNPKKVQFIINRSQQNYGNGADWEENIKPIDERLQLPPPNLPPNATGNNEPLDPDKVF